MSSGLDANTSAHLEAEAFKRIYPEQYFEKFLEHGVRPDGRPLGRARPVSIGLGVVTSADASALVKIGSTTVLAGIKCEIMAPANDRPNEGQINIEVEMAPLASADARPGRPSDTALILTEQLNSLITSDIVDLSQLSIDPGNAAWAAYLDIYVLDADGGLFDACLLATVAALKTLYLPNVALDENGSVQPVSKINKENQSDLTSTKLRKDAPLQILRIPIAQTCSLHKGKFLVDPTAEEEKLSESILSIAVDEDGQVLKMTKPGGRAAASIDDIRKCHEAAKLRATEVRGLLQDAIDTFSNGMTS